MNMKKITFGLSILVASTFVFLSCKKPTPNVEPPADKEVQTAIDASFANFIVTDIDMICSFIGENDLFPKFYLQKAGYTNVATTRDPVSKTLAIGYNTKTRCVDGHIREGSIFMRYGLNSDWNPNPPPNTDYYRDFGFIGAITFSNYKVDGILVENVPGNTYFLVKNKRGNANKPIVDLAWTIEANLQFTDSNSTKPFMTWKGLLTKKIQNLASLPSWTNTAISNSNITWSVTTVEYTGSYSGVTSFSVPYSCKIYDATPLVRDFSCYPDKVAGAVLTNTPGTVSQIFEEFHPFVKGVTSFTTASKYSVDSLNLYPREIYFDNTGNTFGGSSGSGKDPASEFSLPGQCDNKGAVQIKGVYFPIDFRK